MNLRTPAIRTLLIGSRRVVWAAGPMLSTLSRRSRFPSSRYATKSLRTNRVAFDHAIRPRALVPVRCSNTMSSVANLVAQGSGHPRDEFLAGE
jgi:hypothetical protein